MCRCECRESCPRHSHNEGYKDDPKLPRATCTITDYEVELVRVTSQKFTDGNVAPQFWTRHLHRSAGGVNDMDVKMERFHPLHIDSAFHPPHLTCHTHPIPPHASLDHLTLAPVPPSVPDHKRGHVVCHQITITPTFLPHPPMPPPPPPPTPPVLPPPPPPPLTSLRLHLSLSPASTSSHLP
ncbi:hypothetical protein Pcinc_028985 [Petrolisthes cinctipes]|uniref:Uncharacterized protein n=1 Tax=Petrolisthes cinctipes TaxID=88211 RepID=A0AAE1F2M0_PETCI|nr:hypothetical protein Pcinc_028985 [Petrolisthes cinctipes]